METKKERINPFARKLSFPLGKVCSTPGAIQLLQEGEALSMLSRHLRGDWGEVNEQDWKENDFSVTNGYRILSAYKARCGEEIWIITEADRSVTTLLLPDEY